MYLSLGTRHPETGLHNWTLWQDPVLSTRYHGPVHVVAVCSTNDGIVRVKATGAELSLGCHTPGSQADLLWTMVLLFESDALHR